MSTNYTRKKIQNYSYGLGQPIGKGYSSQVFRGRHDETLQPVAVKVIDLKMLKNEINRVLLESEVQILKELKGLPHILALQEVFTTKNNTYIVTELCQGDLSSRIKGGLPPVKALAYMQQILAGYLGFARRQVIHRDLKPANILISEGEQLKVADFGFAIKAADAHKYSKYNVGSPLYMAPESLKRNDYSLKTDIWALGIILYELLTGETPWRAKNEKDLLKKIEAERADDLITKMTAPPQAKEFLRRALKLDKAERMDVEEVAAFDFQVPSAPRSNVLTEKKVNLGRALSIFSPKVEKGELRLLPGGENRASTKELKEISERRPHPLRDPTPPRQANTLRQLASRSLQNKSDQAHKYNPSVTLQLLKREESSTKENPEFMAPKPRMKDEGQAELKAQRKLTSKILVSEIHFCRFLYKLLARVGESRKSGLLRQAATASEQVSFDYMAIIRHKIDNFLGFKSNNYIGAVGYEDYKGTADYQKLMKIAKEYKERYQSEMRPYWNGGRCTFSTDSTLALIQALADLLQGREGQQDFTANYSGDIVVLDYLMTAKQLIDILQHGQNYQRFARKSRIQEIVQGRTAEISWELYLKIANRAREVSEARIPRVRMEQRSQHLMV